MEMAYLKYLDADDRTILKCLPYNVFVKMPIGLNKCRKDYSSFCDNNYDHLSSLAVGKFLTR
jgi:hypothetical protein